MKCRWIVPLVFVCLPAAAQPPGPPGKAGTGPKLQFKEDGDDLVVQITIEGPANRQVVLTDYQIDDGSAPWDQPPIGVEKPRRGPPSVELRFLVLINSDLPGFHNGGLITPPTPPDVRAKGRQDVTWRLPNYRNWGFRREDANFRVVRTEFSAPSRDLRAMLPKVQKTIDEADRRLKNVTPP
jgi:hypothetical protein